MVSTFPGLDTSLGALFVGSFFTTALWGAGVIQTFIYYAHYRGDHILQKAFVALLFLSDTVILLFTGHALYHYLVSHFGDDLALLEIVWSVKAQIIMTCTVVPSVQTLYAYRLVRVAESQRLLPIIVIIMVIVGWALSLITATKLVLSETWNFPRHIAIADFTQEVIIDVTISASITYHLRRRRPGFNSNSSIVNMLLLWVVGTGALTTICACLMLITCVTMPQNLIFLAFEPLLTKLYVNSVLAMLNVRQGLREKSGLVVPAV